MKEQEKSYKSLAYDDKKSNSNKQALIFVEFHLDQKNWPFINFVQSFNPTDPFLIIEQRIKSFHGCVKNLQISAQQTFKKKGLITISEIAWRAKCIYSSRQIWEDKTDRLESNYIIVMKMGISGHCSILENEQCNDQLNRNILGIQIIIRKYQNIRHKMDILICMRSQVHRTKPNSIFILNLFALQFISLIAINRLDEFYLKIAQCILIFGYGQLSRSKTLILINFAFNVALIILFILFLLWKSFKYRSVIIKLFGIILLNFKYIFLIPIGCINVKPLIDPDVTVQFRVYCAFNMVVAFFLSAIQLYTNWSNRFIEKDYCNRRQNSILCLLFQFSFVFSTIIFGSLIGSLFLIAVSLFRAYQVSITVEYPLIQKSTFFYSSLNIYICIIFLMGENKIKFIDLTFKLIVGIFVSMYFSSNACKFINNWYGNRKNLYKFSNSAPVPEAQNNKKVPNGENNEKESLQLQNENKTQTNSKDIIILSRMLLSRSTIQQPNANKSEWDLWWQKFYIIIVIHKITCTNEKCQCKSKSLHHNQSQIMMQDLKRMMKNLQQKQKTGQIRIMSIYVEIQVAKQPLKGYYEIMKMQKQQISMVNEVDLKCLLMEARQCFNRIFIKNNIQNNNLPLLKIIKFEEQIENIQFQIKNVLELTINFFQVFTLNTIKIQQILHDSKKLFLTKQKINEKFYNLVLNFPDNIYVNFLIFIFYQYLQVYKSKQKQLKSITQQKNLKKRLFEKEDNDVFNDQYGVIYIDLVEERGKIKKITKNICQLYGHNYEDMVFFNINQFMPRIFGKNHYKFLNNFIQLGKINILASKNRILFGKNKNKYIFPLQARLKTEHLLSGQFGVTALLRKEQTSSGFIIFNLNGKIEEVSQSLYKIIFYSSLKGEVDKIRRLCLVKMIPKLLHLLNDPNFQKLQNKTYESLLIFSFHQDMMQKFRIYRQPKNFGSSVYSPSTSSYLSSTLDLEMTSNQMSNKGNNFGLAYFGQVYKNFLNDLNIIKLNAFNISFKVSKIKTEQFSTYLLEIISIESLPDSYLTVISQFQNAAESLNIYQEHGNIAQNFQKYQSLIERNDVLNFVFNKNVDMERKKYNEVIKSYNKNKKKEKRKILTIGQDEINNEAASLQSNSAINFEQIEKGMMNQQIQRGGSQRSSVTDQTQSQSKKQMLINAFNSNASGMDKSFLCIVNVMIVIKFAVMIYFIVVQMMEISILRTHQLKDTINLEVRYLYQFRLATYQILDFYEIQNQKRNNVSNWQTNQLNGVIQKLNTEFTDILLQIKKLDDVKLLLTQSSDYSKQISIFDVQLGQYRNITVLQLINQLYYIMNTQTTQNRKTFLELNYESIHNMFKLISEMSSNPSNSAELKNVKSIIFITLGLYQFVCLLIVISWIPMLCIISKKQKRIINFLSTMNVKQLKKITYKLKMIWEHMKSNKNNQINQIISMINHEKNEPSFDVDKQKNIVRNIRLVSQNNTYSIKLRYVLIFVVFFLIFFSMLPLIFYLNVSNNQSYFISILSLIEETSFLACKAPLLVNINLINVNKLYQNKTLTKFSNDLYLESDVNYFNLNSYISRATDLTKDLIQKDGSLIKFNDNICDQLLCNNTQKTENVKFYDQIILIRNTFNQIQPQKLDIDRDFSQANLDKWIDETGLTEMLNWVNKIYLFVDLWNKRFEQLTTNSLDNTEKRLIIIGSILSPFYLLAMIYIEYKIIKKMSGILRDAESVHMHFPVQILVENTYLTSYFNEKIKNNK